MLRFNFLFSTSVNQLRLALLCAPLLGCLMSQAVYAQIYTCRDRSGHVKYSQTPINGCQQPQRVVKVTPQPASSVASGQAQMQTQAKARAESEKATAQSRQQQQEDTTAEQKRRAANAAQCVQIQQQMDLFATGRRLRQADATGQYIPLTEESRQQQMAQMQQYLQSSCPQ